MTFDPIERQEIERRDAIAAALAEHIPDAPAWRIEWIRSYCEGEHGSVLPIEPADRKAVSTFMRKALDLAPALDGIRPNVLPPEVAQELRRALQRASYFGNLRLASGTPKGRRNWQAGTVVAVCRALWTHYRGETLPPRWFNEAHPMMPFLAAMLEAFSLDIDARNAADSWSEVADNPALSIEIED